MQRQCQLLGSALASVLLTALAVTPGSPAIADDCVGSWIGTISFDAGSPSVMGQININRDGTITGTDGTAHSSQVQFPPVLSAFAVDNGDYFGSWVHIGGNQIGGTIKELLFAGPNTPTQIYGPFYVGQNVGIGTLSAEVTCQHASSGEVATGHWTLQLESFFLDKVVITNSGTLYFTPVAIEPLAKP
jgi:hypothetical protein